MGCNRKAPEDGAVMLAWAAALTVLLCVPAYAAKPPPCGKPDAKGRVPLMAEMLACQQLARQSFAAARRQRTGRDPSPEDSDRYDDFQRAQMRAYMEAHPSEATLEGERETERQAEAAGGEPGVLERIAAAVGMAKEALASALGGKTGPATAKPAAAEAEARQALGGLSDGRRMGEVDLEKIAARARSDPAGTLKRAVVERNKQFDANVPEEAKRFYHKPGAAEEQSPEAEE